MSDEKAVLYIITKLELGGAQKVCLALLDEAVKAGFPAGLISGSHGMLVSEVKRFQDVCLLDTFTGEFSLKSLAQEVKNFFKLISYIKLFKKKYPQLIVHTHSTKAGILGRWAALFAGVQYRIHTVHGFGFNRYQPWYKWLMILVAEWITCLITTKFICVSQGDQILGARLLPKFSRKNALIRAAVKLNDSSDITIPAHKNKNSFIIGTISCFKPQKNLLDLFKAFKYACTLVEGKTELNVQLQVIGDGVMRDQLESWIKNNHMSDRITLLGWQHDVAPYLKQWDLFAMSSLWEGLPCAIIEARLSKLPVVAYAIDGIPEVIFDGINGYLVPTGQWNIFGDRMADLILDHERYHAMRNYQDDLTGFSYSVMFQKHYELYNSL